MAKDLKAKIRLEADTRQADQAIRRLQDLVARALSAIGGASASVDVDTSEAVAELEQLQAELSELDGTTATATADVDTGDSLSSVDTISDALQALDATQALAKAGVDTGDAAASLETLRNAVAGFDGETASATARVDTEAALAEIERLEATLRDVDGKSISATANVQAEKGLAELDRLRVSLNAIDGATASTSVAVDTAQGEAALDRLGGSIDAVDGRTARADVSVDVARGQAAIDDMRLALNAIDGTSVASEANVNVSAALSALDQIESGLNAIDGRSVTADVSVDTDGASEAIEDVDLSLASLIGSLGRFAPVATAAAAGFGAFVLASVEFVRIVGETQSANALLLNSFDGVAGGADEAAESVRAFAIEQERLSTFTQVEITRAAALAAAYGATAEQVKDLTRVSLDLSAVKNQDLQTSIENVVRSFATEISTLDEYNIKVTAAAGSTERFSQVIDGLTDAFGGGAAAEANSLSDSIERIGTAVTGIARDLAGAENGLGVVGDAFGLLATGAESLRDSLRALGDESRLDFLSNLIAPGVEPFLKTLRTEFDLLSSGIDTAKTAASGWKQAFVDGIVNVSPVLAKALGLQSSEARKLAAELEDAKDASREMGTAQKRLNKIVEDATSSWKGYRTEVGKLSDAQQQTIDKMKEFGAVIGTEVTNSIKENNAVLERSRDLYSQGLVSREAFEAVQRGVTAANAELTASFENQNRALESTEEATESYTVALGGAVESVDRLTEAERRLIVQQIRAAETRTAIRAREQQDAAASNLLGGTSAFAQAGGGTFSLPDTEIAHIGANGKVTVFAAGPTGFNPADIT